MEMMSKKTPFLALILLCLLLVGSEMNVMRNVEGRMCESPSHRFRRACFSSSNCGTICRTEGFSGGHCKGFRRRCLCRKHC